MKHLITIGEFLPQDVSETGGPSYATLDIDELIRSKALIQGNSGAGKSGLIRVIVEQINLRVPTLIIDAESEFASLREKLDMVLVADNGELKPDVRSAGLLARKLAELGASAIFDLYELKGEQKHLWVKNFLEALMALPRKLWRPTLVVMDEAHLFAPEQGFGSSVALEAVQDWQFRGRKHGLGSILATPRLAALNKNVSGANNIFIGRTSLDVDVKRAAKLIGKSEKNATVELRELGKRRFFCFGPALNTPGMAQFYVADCETSIPQPGVHRSEKPPPASSAVDAIKDKLKDIEQEAEVEIRNLNEAKAEIAKLKRELKQAQSNALPREQDTRRIAELTTALEQAHQKTKTETKVVEKKIVVEGTVTRLEKLLDRYTKAADSLEELMTQLRNERSEIREALTDARRINEPFQTPETKPFGKLTGPVSVKIERVNSATGAHSMARLSSVTLSPARGTANGDGEISGPMQKILNELAELEAVGISPADKAQLGLFCGYTNVKSGGFTGPLGKLREMELIHYPGSGEVALTDRGRNTAAEPGTPLTTTDLQDRIVNKLDGPRAKILRELIAIYPDAIGKEPLGRNLGYTNVKSGGFTGPLGSLRKLGLIEYPQSGTVAASELLFPAGLE